MRLPVSIRVVILACMASTVWDSLATLSALATTTRTK